MIQEVKVCNKCGLDKSVSEFSKSIATKDGLQSKCKSCVREYQKKYNRKLYEVNKEIIVRVCGKCKVEKPISEFNKDKINKSGHTSRCKRCVNEYNNKYNKKYYEENKEKASAYGEEYRKDNKEAIAKYKKKYQKANKEDIAIYQKEYREANKEYMRESRKEYFKNYRKVNRKAKNEYDKKRRRNNIQARLSDNLRSRLYQAIKLNCKVGSAVSDLGCTVDFLKEYLESKFQEGMTWDNYGKNGWHIDHQIPLSSFDLTDREQFLKANHYTNLQPLWAGDNLKKSNKLKWRKDDGSI